MSSSRAQVGGRGLFWFSAVSNGWSPQLSASDCWRSTPVRGTTNINTSHISASGSTILSPLVVAGGEFRSRLGIAPWACHHFERAPKQSLFHRSSLARLVLRGCISDDARYCTHAFGARGQRFNPARVPQIFIPDTPDFESKSAGFQIPPNLEPLTLGTAIYSGRSTIGIISTQKLAQGDEHTTRRLIRAAGHLTWTLVQ
jgi:hypothetical protein